MKLKERVNIKLKVTQK